uniref:Uncharacterized protein n=1 Tax=Oryza punctata TaxID=4537 RepID=A0A0E0JTD4_ORYPU
MAIRMSRSSLGLELMTAWSAPAISSTSVPGLISTIHRCISSVLELSAMAITYTFFTDPLFYLLCRDAHVLADARHRGSDEHGGGDLVREPLHGEREAEAAVAVPDEDQPLAGRSRGDGVEQRARVLLEGAHLVDARRVRARRGHVERRRAVPRGAQRGDHPVPAPRTVAEAVDQDEMLLAAAAADIHF